MVRAYRSTCRLDVGARIAYQINLVMRAGGCDVSGRLLMYTRHDTNVKQNYKRHRQRTNK